MLPEAAGRGKHFQVRGHSFSLYGPSQTKKNSRKKKPRKRYCDRGQKIRTALRTNQIAGFVTVPAWKK